MPSSAVPLALLTLVREVLSPLFAEEQQILLVLYRTIPTYVAMRTIRVHELNEGVNRRQRLVGAPLLARQLVMALLLVVLWSLTAGRSGISHVCKPL